MATNSAPPPDRAHRLLSEMPHARPAKVTAEQLAKDHLKKSEARKVAIGRCVALARKSRGWSQKELADAIEQVTGEKRDLAQLSRWESGKERPQFDVLLGIAVLFGPLVIQFAGLSPDTDVQTVITVRKSA